MVTPDGWRVEIIHIDGAARFRVKRHGSLVGGPLGRDRGIHYTVEQVANLLGDSFPLLVEI